MDVDMMLTISKRFSSTLSRAADGKKTSLPFITQQIPKSPVVAGKESFQVMVIGGSVGKSAIGKKVGTTVKFSQVKDITIPVMKDKKTVLDLVSTYIHKNVKFLAVNFAYPMTPVFENGVLDGKLLAGTKEHAFAGMYKSPVGQMFADHLPKVAGEPVVVSVANDTICLLMSGLTRHTWSELAAGVVGTGLNFSFFLDADKPVNLESAFFSEFPRSAEGKQIDCESLEKGKSIFEKEVSGAYLYKHFNLIAQKEGMDVPALTTTGELNDLARKKLDSGSGLARLLLERSAALVACQIAGITLYKKQDMAFIMEGSLFWHALGYKQTVERYLRYIMPQYKITFVQIKDSDLLGAARLIA